MIPVIFGIGIIVRDIDISHRREAGENAVIASVLPVSNGIKRDKKAYDTLGLHPEKESSHIAIVSIIIVEKHKSGPVCNWRGVLEYSVEMADTCHVPIEYHIDSSSTDLSWISTPISLSTARRLAQSCTLSCSLLNPNTEDVTVKYKAKRNALIANALKSKMS